MPEYMLNELSVELRRSNAVLFACAHRRKEFNTRPVHPNGEKPHPFDCCPELQIEQRECELQDIYNQRFLSLLQFLVTKFLILIFVLFFVVVILVNNPIFYNSSYV